MRLALLSLFVLSLAGLVAQMLTKRWSIGVLVAIGLAVNLAAVGGELVAAWS